ncbi:MAG: hypothetical protein R2719_09355 [Micropruina sp.]
MFPQTDRAEEAVAWTGLVNGYNIVTQSRSRWSRSHGKARRAKLVHCACLLLAAAGLASVPFLTNQYLIFIPMIGFGIAWASIMGVPTSWPSDDPVHPAGAVYMGIINMMIVIPMLIQSVTFG